MGSNDLGSALPYANLALFVAQIVITAFSFANSDLKQQYETLITPAGYAFSIWNVIYFFTFTTAITDVAFPGLSVFNFATNPTPLRGCFALACVFNTGWVLLFNSDWPKLAGVDITLLWLVLLPLYLFLNLERDVRPVLWRQYLCSELSIRLYFSWITAATVVSWTITAQILADGFLALGAYLALLSVLVVSAVVGVVYGKDPVIGMVTVWACIGITQKDLQHFPADQHEKELRIQAAATLAASVMAVLVLVTVAEHAVTKRRLSRAWLFKVNAGAESKRDYGTISTGSKDNALSRSV